MSDFFPRDERESLALMYLQNQDLKGKTPDEIYNLYKDTVELLKQAEKDRKRNKHGE